jgi:hypothetical protein
VVPLIAGAELFEGGVTKVTGVGTTPVAAEVAIAEPAELLAVTETRTVFPASAAAMAYAGPVAALIGAHEAPAASHCCHWYA